MWLFLDRHREGDLRRMAHLYPRNPDTLWPTGVYVNLGFPPLVPTSDANGGLYGEEVVFQWVRAMKRR